MHSHASSVAEQFHLERSILLCFSHLKKMKKKWIDALPLATVEMKLKKWIWDQSKQCTAGKVLFPYRKLTNLYLDNCNIGQLTSGQVAPSGRYGICCNHDVKAMPDATFTKTSERFCRDSGHSSPCQRYVPRGCG